MTSDELKELHERLKYAAANGFAVASAEGYADELVASGAMADPPEGVAALSAAHLLSMVDSLKDAAPVKVKKSAPKPASAPPPAPKKADAPKAEPLKQAVAPKVDPALADFGPDAAAIKAEPLVAPAEKQFDPSTADPAYLKHVNDAFADTPPPFDPKDGDPSKS